MSADRQAQTNRQTDRHKHRIILHCQENEVQEKKEGEGGGEEEEDDDMMTMMVMMMKMT